MDMQIKENRINCVVEKRFFNNVVIIKSVGCLVDLIIPGFNRFLRLGENLGAEKNKN